MKERQVEHHDGWASRIGLILAVASGAIGLGNFLRFPGQAVKWRRCLYGSLYHKFPHIGNSCLFGRMDYGQDGWQTWT